MKTSIDAAAPALKSATLATGVTLPYVEQGPPTGIPVVLLHGVTDSWRSFECVLPHLSDALHVFALTLRGHGDADRPAHGYRVRDFACDVAAFMDAVGLAQAIVVGHSMGGTVAQRFAIDYAGRTRGLVLIGGFASYRDNPVIVDLWENGVAHLTDPIDPAFAREFQDGTLAQQVPPALFETAVRESLKVPARVWRAAFEGLLEDDCAYALHRITAPALLVWGDRDAFVPRSDQTRLLAAIAGARLLTYQGAGHALHWEEPERFADDLTAFCHAA
jgi:pimeloyl-ACP methyl ester carboxylesterase